MGSENSKIVENGEAKATAPPDPVNLPPSPPQSAAPTPKAAKPTPKAKPGVWMTPKATNRASPAEIRRPATTDGVRLSGHSRSAVGAKPPKPEPVEEEEEPELTPEQKKAVRKEEAKQEMIGRMNNFIKAAPSKLPDSMTSKLPRAAVVPASFHGGSETVKQKWSGQYGVSKAEALQKIQEKHAEASAKSKEPLPPPEYMPAMSPENVGDHVEVSMKDTVETFSNFQGAVHSFIAQGLTEQALEPFLFEEEAEQHLTTYEKWSVIRNAAEQVLQVYANRANASWIETEAWQPPAVLAKDATSANVYSGHLDSAISQGQVALYFIDDGHLVETSASGHISPLLNLDLWQVIKELAPHKVPSQHRLERLSVLGRHLLHAAVTIEMTYGATALRHLKVVLGVDCEQEQFTIMQLQEWSFFNLDPNNVAILPLPRFHGFAEDPATARLAQVPISPKIMLGTGYAMFLLNSPAEAYTLTPEISPKCLEGSVLEWLKESGATWLMTGLFADIDRLKPEGIFDRDFLTASMYAVDRGGANMAMEVQLCKEERDMRTNDSVVLRRDSMVNKHPLACYCNLRPSSMRTVKSYQVLKSHAKNSEGFYSATHRYVFKVSGLQNMLIDPSLFHADIRLVDFYAYATFDLGDITTFFGARCAAILARPDSQGPDMANVVYGKPWLIQAAKLLEMQDKVDAFRSKAIDLINYDQLARKPGTVINRSHSRIGGVKGSEFKERKRGFNVLLLMGPEHGKVAPFALRLAKLFVHQIVDKLQIVILASSSDSVTDMQSLLGTMNDKELEFNGQLTKGIVVREPDSSTVDTITDICNGAEANMVVVPSVRLAGQLKDLGALASSLAFSVCRLVTHLPILVVKANTVGKWTAPGQYVPEGEQRGKPDGGGVTVMCLLDTTHVTPMVEYMSAQMSAHRGDVLCLCKTSAFEVPGQLSMRSRRVFVQARMAVGSSLHVEERAYQGNSVIELPKAVENEGVDILTVSVNGELPISKDLEALLKSVKTSVFIFRDKDAMVPQSGVGFTVVDADEAEDTKARRTSTR